MGAYEARQNQSALRVEYLLLGIPRDQVGRRSNGGYLVSIDEDGSVLDELICFSEGCQLPVGYQHDRVLQGSDRNVDCRRAPGVESCGLSTWLKC